MKHIIAIFALISVLSAAPANAQEVGVAFKNWGQCTSTISQYFTQDWESTKTTGGKATSQAAYQHQYRCEKIGEYWYIVPAKT